MLFLFLKGMLLISFWHTNQKGKRANMIHILEVISDTNMGGAGRLLLARLEKTNREKIRTTVLLPKGSL